MLSFNYSAHDPKTGKTVSGKVDAEDERSASNLLVKEGLTPIEVKSEQEHNLLGFEKYFNRVASKDKVLFSRQMATLVNAGLPLLQALRNVNAQTTSKPFQKVINDLIISVEGGASLSASMAKHKNIFNEVYVNLIAAGEASGTLDKSLERLAIQQEKDADIISKIRGAMAYPIIVICVMIVVIGFMVVKIIPGVAVLYNSLPGAKLPLVTIILLDVAHFFIKFWWIVIILIGVIGFGSTRWARTVGGKRVIDKIKMKAWPIGPLFMKVYMARFARTSATLVSSGVPLIQMLETTARAVNNVHIEDSIDKAIEQVKGGKALSDALTNDKNFTPLVPNMIKIGEQSGTIDQMLDKVATYYETEVDNEINTIQTLMEPVLMIILGIFAFIIVAAVLLPVYSLANNNNLTSAF
ncbi:MAG TPA: type II secretion system F family protein [Candidatus Saccharimonadales bacterium]|nr:type II secretion system F family protein [Candidatus Saccharimonadales bacterium]